MFAQIISANRHAGFSFPSGSTFHHFATDEPTPMKLTRTEWKLVALVILALGGGAIVHHFRHLSPPADQAPISPRKR